MPALELSRRGLIALATLLAIALGAGVAYIYLPQARITITPAASARSVSKPILLSSKATAPDFVAFVLPTRVAQVSATEERAQVRAGAKTLEDFAKGSVVLHNKLSEEQQLLPKTHLRHEATGIFFLTDSPVAIPANSSIAVHVTAKAKGEAGNVPAGRFIVDKLAPDIQDEVYGESAQAFTGGVAVEEPLTQAEIDTAKQAALAAAKERARGELTGAAGGAALREDLITYIPEEEFVSAEVGSKTREFTVRIRLKARAFIVDENDVLSLTLLALRSDVGADEEFKEYEPESFGIKIVRADFERGEAQIEGSLTGFVVPKVGPTILDASALAGLAPEEVRARLSEQSTIESVEIELSPFWVQSVPARAGAVEIIVKSD